MSMPIVVSGNRPSLVSAMFISTSARREAGSRHQIRHSRCCLSSAICSAPRKVDLPLPVAPSMAMPGSLRTGARPPLPGGLAFALFLPKLATSPSP